MPHGRADFPVDHPLARFPNPDRPIEPATIVRIKREALEGDAQAAFWLSLHYIDSVNDVLEGEFWLRLAAELGDCDARADFPRFRKNQRGRTDWQPILKLDACAPTGESSDVPPRK